MMGDHQVRFCERLGVKFPLPTRLLPVSPAPASLQLVGINLVGITPPSRKFATCGYPSSPFSFHSDSIGSIKNATQSFEIKIKCLPLSFDNQ